MWKVHRKEVLSLHTTHALQQRSSKCDLGYPAASPENLLKMDVAGMPPQAY